MARSLLLSLHPETIPVLWDPASVTARTDFCLLHAFLGIFKMTHTCCPPCAWKYWPAQLGNGNSKACSPSTSQEAAPVPGLQSDVWMAWSFPESFAPRRSCPASAVLLDRCLAARLSVPLPVLPSSAHFLQLSLDNNSQLLSIGIQTRKETSYRSVYHFVKVRWAHMIRSLFHMHNSLLCKVF